MPYLASPGRCIYCPSKEGLTREHVIPESLGGKLIIRNASCKKHRDITSKLEGIVTKDMYKPLRLRLGLLGNRKHRKRSSTHWPITIKYEDNTQNIALEVTKLPQVYYVIQLPPPGIITNQPLTNKNPKMQIICMGNKSEIESFTKEFGAERLENIATLEWNPFARMIAKICHAYAVGHFGLDGIDYFLPPIISGESNYISQFIGGVSDEKHALQPPNDLSLGFYEIRDGDYIFVRTTIFGNNRFPTYEAIVGKIIDMDLVLGSLSTLNKKN